MGGVPLSYRINDLSTLLLDNQASLIVMFDYLSSKLFSFFSSGQVKHHPKHEHHDAEPAKRERDPIKKPFKGVLGVSRHQRGQRLHQCECRKFKGEDTSFYFIGDHDLQQHCREYPGGACAKGSYKGGK